MKFYIASRLENAEEVKRVANVLKAAGHEQTYDWTAHGSVEDEGEPRMAEVALAETNGVANADLVLVLLPGGRGTHTELGIAIGRGKAILLCGFNEGILRGTVKRQCSFYQYPGNVKRILGPMDAWLTRALQFGVAHDYARLEGRYTQMRG